MVKVLRSYPCSLLCVVAILWLCLCRPPHVSMGGVSGLDKVAHCMMFFGLSSLILWEYKKRHARENLRLLLLIAFAAPLAFGALIEVLQGTLTDYRSADLFDFLADAFGVLLAWLLVRFFLKKYYRE